MGVFIFLSFDNKVFLQKIKEFLLSKLVSIISHLWLMSAWYSFQCWFKVCEKPMMGDFDKAATGKVVVPNSKKTKISAFL